MSEGGSTHRHTPAFGTLDSPKGIEERKPLLALPPCPSNSPPAVRRLPLEACLYSRSPVVCRNMRPLRIRFSLKPTLQR